MNKLLENITLDDLRDNDKELAELIGIDAWKKLVEVYGGTSKLYIPQADMVILPLRNELIRREFDGFNSYQLSRKWNMSERNIREIVKDKIREISQRPIEGQLQFDLLA